MVPSTVRVLVSVCAIVIGFSTQALDSGDALPAMVLQDQFGKPVQLTALTKRLYFTHDMAGGKLLKAVLGEKGQAVLDAQQAVAITDVSGMPAMIRSMMALPAMKKRSYAIGVDTEGKQTAGLPHPSDHVVVIDLDALKVTRVTTAGDEKNLAALMAP